MFSRLIDGVIFESIQQASGIINVPCYIIRKRLNSQEYPEWVKLNK